MFDDYCTEVEGLDGCMDEGYLEDLAFKRRFNNSKIFNRGGTELYIVIQDSRKESTPLMLVDRKKSKNYWWTHDQSIALKGSKKYMDKIVSKLKRNNARVVSYGKYFNSL